MSVICQAKPLTRRFVIELEQNADFSNQNFFIKLDRRTLSDNPLPDNKRHKHYIYGMKTTLIDSISWQWLHATNLLVAYELILTPKDTFQCPTLYSSLPLEAVITIVWLLKNYWNPYSPLFNPIEHQEASQKHPFAITTLMPGSEQNPPQYQPSQSSGQHTPQATAHITGYFTSLLYSDSGSGNEDPEQHLHTLGLNCFIYPCNGVCRFRQSSDPSNSVNGVASDSMIARTADTTTPVGQATCNVILIGNAGQLQKCGKVIKNKKALRYHIKKYHTGQKTCDITSLGEDDRPRPCGKVFRSAQALYEHKSKVHSGKKTCDVTEVAEDGQLRLCGLVCKNSQSLSNHKRYVHTRQQTCDANVVGEYGRLYPCGKLCKNAKALSNHKNQYHTGQKTCDVKVVGEDGQPRPCGVVCQNAKILWNHKARYHSKEKICKETVVGLDGQPRPCGKVCKGVTALSDHKRKHRKRKAVNVNQDNGLTP
ncbi:hypothetical protein [Endozoicomonas sp. 8E]|uniref:hypothetical protein n=1 Tax=Endozoicomonas sp. 8E TaxID=3035692 RepID=UPI002938E74A|nr:hypothetical protein [Endozoicomonas sp. 8E]WOG26923.1 hypothetical protein P6910_20595 [Endozoicomonas sp. 8E]